MAKRNAEVVLQYSTVYPFRERGKNTMVCVYCCEEFAEPDLYRLHMDTAHQKFTVATAFAHIGRGSKDYLKVDCLNLKCRLCSEPFDNLEEVAHHIAITHDSPEIKKMNLEYKIAMQPYRLIKDKWHCFICDKKLPTFNKLCRHTTSHYLQYTCDICARSYLTNEALKYHIRCCHTGNYVCRKCWQDFPTDEQKRAHVRTSKKCWSFGCVHCGERFQSWEFKHKHLVLVHGYENVSYRCPDCNKTFKARKYFYKHYKLNHTDEAFICSCCGLKFSTKNHLEDHRLGHTGEKSFKCPICSKGFTRNKSLVQHMWIHNKSKRFVCLVCEKQFAQKVSFKAHMKNHHPEVPFQWPPLDKHGRSDSENEQKKKIVLVYQTPQRRNAELILVCSTAYPFKTRFSQILCSYCHEEYNSLSDLRYHMKTEHINSDFKNVFYRAKDNLIKVDITNLKCKLCSMDMQDVDGLMNHLYTEHRKPVKFNARYGVLPYKQNAENNWLCVYCNKIFTAFISFKRHIVTHFMNFSCDKCGTTFVSEHALRDHHRQVKCFRTAYKPRNGRALKPRTNAEIILQYSTASPFRTWKSNFNCVFCRVQSNDPSGLRMHVVTSHANYDVKSAFYKKLGNDFLNIDITDLQCKLCFLPLDTFDTMIYHLKNDHQQPLSSDAQFGVLPFRLNNGTLWKCTICPNEFKDFVSLKKHTSEHFQNYVCDTCGEGFITESAMVAHTKIPHENKYNCSRCIATFSSLDERNHHVKTQHTSMPYMCMYCKDKPRFTNWEVRKKHLMAVHNYKTGADKYECTTCQKSFKTRSGKYNHMARVHRIKKDTELNYPCPSCPKAFTTKLFLDKHVAKKHFDL